MKNFKAIFILLVLSLATSCIDKNNEDTTVIGDVMVISKKSDDNTVYALAYYAYSYIPLKSVKVQGAASSTSVDLTSTGAYSTNYFSKEPTDEDFSTTKPSEDTFTFDAEFGSGSTSVAHDILTSDILDPVTIETCQFNVTSARAEFKWTALTNADSYSIVILDDSGSLVFASDAIAKIYTSVYVEAGTAGWTTGHPATGKTYTVRIFANKYEDSNNLDSYNIQSSSYSQATIVWGTAESL